MKRSLASIAAVMIAITTAAGQTRPAAALLSDPPPAMRPSDTLRVASFNIRNSGANDGDNAWPKRQATFIAAVRAIDPDVLGMQEVLADQQDAVAAALTEYDSVFAGRDDGKRRGEASPVFFRRAKFTLVDHGTFWLSPTPEKVGSVGWDAALTRVCTWAVLRHTDGRELLVANTHFDHRGIAARTHSAELIRDCITTLAAGRPIVLTGDLNSGDNTDAYAALAGDDKPATRPTARLVDAFRRVFPQRSPDEATFHAFRGGVRAVRIDYVFCTPDFEPTAAGIDRRCGADGRWPSDHYAVWADLRWGTNRH